MADSYGVFKLVEVDKNPDDGTIVVKVKIKSSIPFIAADCFVNYDPEHWDCVEVIDPDPEDGWKQWVVRVDEETFEGTRGNVNFMMGSSRGQIMQPGKYGTAKLKFSALSDTPEDFRFEWDRSDPQREHSRTKLVDSESRSWEEPDIKLKTKYEPED
jgi:hypothetical protein